MQCRLHKIYQLSRILLLLAATAATMSAAELLNVSYDPTRELYRDMNADFAKHWRAAHREDVTIRMSHGGSGKQARAVVDGLEADVVTLAVPTDVDAIAAAGLLPRNWQLRLPQHSAPYTSTVVFLVRSGNPKKIRDWDDLVRPGISVITPNPKTSGGARWNYLAAWGYARQKFGSDASARDFVARLFANVPVLDSGARGATTTFVERGIGDVYVAWENEALLITKKIAPGRFEIVTPSVSISAEPPVAVVDRFVAKHGTKKIVDAYVGFLYSPVGQTIAAEHYFRPRDPRAAARAGVTFSKVNMFTVEQMFGGWTSAQAAHFSDGGEFDRMMAARK